MKRPLYIAAAAWMLGELIAGHMKEKLAVLLALGFLCYLLLIKEDFIRRKSKKSLGNFCYTAAVVFFCVMTGFVTMKGLLDKYVFYEKIKDGEVMEIEGEVQSVKEGTYGYTVIVKVQGGYVRDTEEVLKKGVYVQVEWADNPCLKAGQTVNLTVKKRNFERCRNEGNFDEQEYYYSQKIAAKAQMLSCFVTDRSYHVVIEQLGRIRERLCDNLDKACEEEEAAVIKAIVYGNKEDLSGEEKELFQKNGIAHILAVSGLHMSIAGMGVYRLFRRRFSFVVSGTAGTVLLVCFGIMTGFGISVKRALCMMLLKIMADMTGRTYDVRSAMGLSILVILADNPYGIYSSSFLLSYSAVFSVGILGQEAVNFLLSHIKSRKEKRKKRKYLGFVSGIMLWVFQLPLLSYLFYEVPLYSVLLNFIVIPLMSFLFFSGMAASAAAFLWEPLGIFISGAAVYIVKFYHLLCTLTAKFPSAYLVTGRPGTLSLIFYYTMAAAGLIFMELHVRSFHIHEIKGRFGKFVCFFLFLLAESVCICSRPARQGMGISMLDVGQGDCILAENENGHTYLIDGGSSDISQVAKYRIVPALKYRGVSKLDYVFISHGDSDHINGIIEMLEENTMRIDHLVLGNCSQFSDSYEELIEWAERRKTKVIYVGRGDLLTDGGVQFQILSPGRESYQDINDSSVVMNMLYGDFSMCFTGDISQNTEEELLPVLRRADILKAAHHGSKYSGSEAFLNAVSPKATFISCGEKNRYGHPHKEALERLKAVCPHIYATLWNGQIQIYVPQEGRGTKFTVKARCE